MRFRRYRHETKNYYPTSHSAQYNTEGYKDLTAYYALCNIEREERLKRHAKRRQRTLPPALEGMSAELSSFLSDLADPYQMSVLIEHFVNLKTMEQIMEILDRSRSFVKVKHRSGFAEAEKLYDNRKNKI